MVQDSFRSRGDSLRHLGQVARPESSASAVTDVEDVDALPPLYDAVDDTIDMRLVPVQQMPEFPSLGSYGAAVGCFFQAKDFPLEAPIPAECCGGFACVNVVEE